MKGGFTAMTQRQRDRVPRGSMLALPDPRRPDRVNPPTNFLWSLFFSDSTGMIHMHWVTTGQTVNKEYYDEVLREFSKRFRRKRLALFKSGQWHFQQDNAPVNNSILVTDYLTKMGDKTVPQPLHSPDLAPSDFSLFPKFKGCRYETIEEIKEAVTKVIDTLKHTPWGLPVVDETVLLVDCNRRRLLRRGLGFHVSIINKCAHTKKVWKLI